VVLVLRARLPESRAWQAASCSATAPSAAQALAQLFSAPWRKPLLALACFYALVNLAANTSGQFKTLIFTSLGGFTVSQTGLLGLALLGVAFVSTLGFMRLVDGPHRMRWFALGGALYAGAQTLPLLLGFNGATLVACALLSGVGGAVAGEPMWKIWSQELFPTLLRATAQGLTTFVTRMVAAAAALVTPALLQAGPGYLYGSFALAIALTTVLGLAVIARLPRAAA
jgi:inositol transporter-like SP family MFS transporter